MEICYFPGRLLNACYFPEIQAFGAILGFPVKIYLKSCNKQGKWHFAECWERTSHGRTENFQHGSSFW